ncbi:MAG: hypothetical protein A2X94_10010 [Bdellovibrionales bacterium GWB1_55_8]|nr:MAG: hypothetical protein A2X94_10010 [Bdellovibrionales bacterium GWB1_55_8]
MSENSILVIPDRLVKAVAKERLGGRDLGAIVLEQAWTEWRLKIVKNLSFRTRANPKACNAYCGMEIREFEGINARQRWANWRTVPRNLSGALADQPVRAIDLCCGIGHSTEVLACYLPAGSSVLGLEFNPEFVARAKLREYRDLNGSLCQVDFRAQSVLEEFKMPDESPVPSASMDIVNCCGAVGHHFRPEETTRLASEINRVLRPGGLALIDSGEAGTSMAAVIRIFTALGFEVVRHSKSHLLDVHAQVCFKK